tara:strand:+ start:883 stop:1323 length:441 start_codon:yes stop_codon:yes gene_type:complete
MTATKSPVKKSVKKSDAKPVVNKDWTPLKAAIFNAVKSNKKKVGLSTGEVMAKASTLPKITRRCLHALVEAKLVTEGSVEGARGSTWSATAKGNSTSVPKDVKPSGSKSVDTKPNSKKKKKVVKKTAAKKAAKSAPAKKRAPKKGK